MYWLLGAFMRTEFYVFLYWVASGPRVKLAGCKSALTPPQTHGCSKAVVPVLVLLFVSLWFILRDDLF